MTESPRREPGQAVTAAYLREGKLRYAAEDREIVGRNGSYFNNRPLYGPANAQGVVLAGDRPFLRLIAQPYVHGALAAGILRNGAGRWLHEFAEVETRYRCGRMTWRMTDASLPGVQVTLVAAPLAMGAGFAARLSAEGLRAGDRLVWTFGGAQPEESPRNRWDPVNHGNPQVRRSGDPVKAELRMGPMPEWCRGNIVHLEDFGFRLAATADASHVVRVWSDRGGTRSVADAAVGADPASAAASTAREWPLACETIELRAGRDEIFWSAAVAASGAAPAPVEPARAFAEALAYLESVERMQTETPDAFLDAAVAAVCHPVDAGCERDPFVFRHGCMSFSIHLIGWRVIHGATVLGWHERVRGHAAYYAAAQTQENGKRTEPRADAGLRLCHEGQESRFYGRGRIAIDQHFYNTQSQFFDQTIHDWRWTADPEMEKILRPALELHLEWARACFDPDDDGLYESYINTLPTDSMWYNGGGSVEESAYVYYGHRAAADMARRAGDDAGAARHRAQADKIQCALREVLWLKDGGYFGLYLEQGGHRRVHPDSWTYSQFLPIDAGMTTAEEGLQALYYTEWALERTRLPFGGTLCQMSNWVPSKWSVRDVFSGDMCGLALAYFQTGLGDEGWELLRGSNLETAFAGAMPGGFSHVGAGADFGDSVHMFPRVVAEGLFGYDPDYPNGVVRIHPAFPSAWPSAVLGTPDFTLQYEQEGDAERYRLTLAREAEVEFRLAVRAGGVRRVTLNGGEVAWRFEPGFGCTLLCGRTPSLREVEVRIELANRVPAVAPQNIEANVGDEIRLELDQGRDGRPACPPPTGDSGVARTGGPPVPTLEMTHWRDFHDILEGAQMADGALRGRVARRPGHHIILAEVRVGALPQWRTFKLAVSDPVAEAAHAARTLREAPPGADWTCLDLSLQTNGDVRAIFQQQYLSPRPKTCSVRLGVDGYSAWTFPHWKEGPPVIDLSGLDRLAAEPGRIRTPQNATFALFSEARNIAFTSLWDNWPRAVSVPVHRTADAVWLLVCGSAFPMHLRSVNAELRFCYEDGGVEKLELVPPLNFWSLCPWGGVDYSYETDAFCLPAQPPPAVQLGRNCRAMVLSWKLRPGVPLREVTLETLSPDVVIGLMGVSLANASSSADSF